MVHIISICCRLPLHSLLLFELWCNSGSISAYIVVLVVANDGCRYFDLCGIWFAMVVAIEVADLWIYVAYSLWRCVIGSCLLSFMVLDLYIIDDLVVRFVYCWRLSDLCLLDDLVGCNWLWQWRHGRLGETLEVSYRFLCHFQWIWTVALGGIFGIPCLGGILTVVVTVVVNPWIR